MPGLLLTSEDDGLAELDTTVDSDYAACFLENLSFAPDINLDYLKLVLDDQEEDAVREEIEHFFYEANHNGGTYHARSVWSHHA